MIMQQVDSVLNALQQHCKKLSMKEDTFSHTKAWLCPPESHIITFCGNQHMANDTDSANKSCSAYPFFIFKVFSETNIKRHEPTFTKQEISVLGINS